MDYVFYFTGSLEAITNVQLVGINCTLCFLQESLLFCVFLQLLSFSRYFLLCLFTNPFQAVPMEAIIVKSASIISNIVRAVDSGLVNTSQKEGRTKLIEGCH